MKELRVTDVSTDEGRVLTGVPIVFDQPTLIHDPRGDYYEVIKRGALDGADISDSTLIYNHDANRVPLARTPRTMQFEIAGDGLHMRAVLADTQTASEVYQAVERGDLRGMSFAFTVPEGGSSYDARTNTRTISRISKVYEVSIVPRPAYPQTSVEARAQMDEGKRDQARRRQALIICNQIISNF